MSLPSQRREGTRFVLAAIVLVLLALNALADDWPHWRGPSRNGHVDEHSGYADGEWLGEPFWRRNVGDGSSSPLVVGDRLYSIAWRDGRDHVVAMDAATGRELWSHTYPSPKYGRKSTGDKGLYSSVCSTPEYDTATGLLYTLGIDGDLCCWDTTATGRPVWNRRLYDEYDVPKRPRVGRSGQRDYGYTTSPLVHGDWLLVEVGATNGNLVAFDKRTGRERWRSENVDPPGHTGGPVPITVDGIPAVVVHTFEGVVVTRLDGRNAGWTIGSVPWKTDYANTISTPAVHGNSVVVTSAYNHKRIARFDVSAKGLREVWRVRPGANTCSPVVVDDCVLTVQGRLHCLDFETGETKWSGGRYGTPVSIVATGDGRLITWSNRGDLTLLDGPRRAPSEYRQLAQVRGVFRRDVWPHVVLANGRLYGKDRDGNLACWELVR